MSNIAQNPSEIALNNNAVTICDGQPMASSYEIAQTFGKRHSDVLERIRTLDCSDVFRERNFPLTEQSQKVGAVTRKIPCCRMTFDGFVFLVGGFTGKKAAAFKEAYIARFNLMRDSLSQRNAPAAPADPASLLRAMLAGNRFLCHLDDMGRVSLREIPDSHLIINPERLPSYLADPYGPKPQWLPGIAEVAVRRLGETGGHHAVQQALHAVNPDYLLVLQSELYSALYRATPEITTMKEVARGR